MRYIHQRSDWPRFTWNEGAIAPKLAAVRLRQGRLLGRIEALGFSEQADSSLKALTLEVVKSSEIEGEALNADQVRSSIARHLGLDIAGLVPSDRRVEGVVEMTLDAVQNIARPLTAQRLFRWHQMLFAGGARGARIGAWRDDSKGPMRVISGAMGRERAHFEAPEAKRLDAEMDSFFKWANSSGMDLVLKAAQAHLWFVTIHPFDDGNGRIARAIADWALAQSDGTPRRFYSMSAQIRRERKDYYDILERAQKGSLDVTDWMKWFLGCLDRAIAGAEDALALVFRKDRFWKAHADKPLNERQRLMLNKLLDGFEGKLMSSKWAKLCKCSQDTAHRDIVDLLEWSILKRDEAGGRSTSYSLVNFE